VSSANTTEDMPLASLEIDLGDWDLLEQIPKLIDDGRLPDELIVWIPLPNLGSTQSHYNICSDLANASYAAENLGVHAKSLKVYFEETKYSSCYKLILTEPSPGIWDVFKQCAMLFSGDENEITASWDLDLVYIYCLVGDFEDEIDSINALAPDIIDHYNMNLVYGVYRDSEYEEVAKHGLRQFPERNIGYCRSAASSKIGADCYVSTQRWAIPSDLDLDWFFTVTNEKFRLSQFEEASQYVAGDEVFEFGKTVAIRFNISDYKSCGIVTKYLIKCGKPKKKQWPQPAAALRKRCLVHETGAVALIDDGVFIHVLYYQQKLSRLDTQKMVASLGELAASAAELTGLGKSITMPWQTLNDEQFESLCYDVIWLDPRFDDTTIKKMGKSRSRDGGRDIVVHEKSRAGQPGRKWIFQCKLVRDNSSLTPSKVQNIGDMLEQYGAEGFGLMTSTVIDPTLTDRVEAICKSRNLAEGHFDVFQLERVLARNQGIRARYFSQA